MKLNVRIFVTLVLLAPTLVLLIVLYKEMSYMSYLIELSSAGNLHDKTSDGIVLGNANIGKATNLEEILISTTAVNTIEPRENLFPDLHKFSLYNPGFRRLLVWPPFFTISPRNPTLGELRGEKLKPDAPNWKKFNFQITKQFLYDKNSQVVEDLLHDMATQNIIAVEQHPDDMQFKLKVTFENGGQALFRPQRYPNYTELHPNIFDYSDFDRHSSEIAAFHLDRIMGFRRVPPTVGRKVNVSGELYRLADMEQISTFFVSQDGNYCFHGKCPLYCDTHHAFCGDPEMIEGSFSAWILSESDYVFGWSTLSNPWKRSNLPRIKREWKEDPYYCVNTVMEQHPFNKDRRLYDVIDATIFDFLIGNMDRQKFYEFTLFGKDSSGTLIHLDNGRGFGQADRDEKSILIPLVQCCMVRLSTFNKIYSFHVGPKPLSDLMRESLKKDPLAPVLSEAHLGALDRRVVKVLQAIERCIKANPPAVVLLDDIL